MASFPILFPECVVEPNLSNLSLYPLKPGHFIQKNKKNKQDLCGCMVSPVYKCHNKNQDPRGACKQRQQTTGTHMFTSLFLCQCQI